MLLPEKLYFPLVNLLCSLVFYALCLDWRFHAAFLVVLVPWLYDEMIEHSAENTIDVIRVVLILLIFLVHVVGLRACDTRQEKE